MNIAAFVAQGVRYARAILGGRRADFVIASSTYPLDILAARRIASLSGAELIFEVHDLWPLSPMELGGMKASNPFIVVMQWAENLAYRSASKVVSLLPNTLEHMRAHGMESKKFLHIPNGVDREAWKNSRAPIPAEHANVLRRLKDKGHFIVGYAGSHGLANSLETVLDAAPLLEGYPATFVLVGQGPDRDALTAIASARGLKNVIFLPAVNRAAVPQLLTLFDAAYLGWRRQPLYRFGISPNKLIDYMMAGVPVIHGVAAANDPVAEADCGYSIPPEDPRSLAEAVVRMFDLPASERRKMGERGRQFILKNQTYDVLAQRFLNGISEVIKEK